MKVLQVNTVFGSGSTGRIAKDLYDTLEANGHQCCVAYGRGNSLNGYNTVKIGNKLDIYAHVLKTRVFDLHGFGSKKATIDLINFIKSYNPDVIHLHNLHGYYINIEILFNYLSTLSIPIVWLLHDQWAISGHSAYFNLDVDGNIPEYNSNKKQKYEYPKTFLFSRSKQNYQRKRKIFTSIKNMTIVTPSDWLNNIVKKSFLSKYPIKVINNGIDISQFKPTPSEFRNKYGLVDKKVILGVASIWEERKGLSFFNKIAKHLDENTKIILVGIEKKEMKKLQPNIISISRTESIRQLAEIYTAADVFVNPTLEDNFPTTNIESLACGTPVITFNTGGSPESIDENSGIVVERGNINKLINTVMKFNPINYSEKYCVERANKYYAKNVINLQYLNLYNSLI